jgi:sugar-specific transcriptional regulator TrmB
MNIKHPQSVLEKIGFSKDESIVYRTLLDLGPCTMTDIVRKTGLHRPKAYSIVAVLVDKELVGVMPKGKQKQYVAESPDKIEKLFTSLEEQFNKEIQSLYDSYETKGKKPIVTYAEGDKAITNAYSDIVHSLKKNDTYYRYSSALTLSRKKYVPKDYKEVRDRKGLERLVITDESSKNSQNIRLGRTVKAVPKTLNLLITIFLRLFMGTRWYLSITTPRPQ